MKLKKSVIDILKILETKKIKNINVKLNNLFFKKNHSIQQLNTLTNYQSDYYSEFLKKIKIGISNIHLENYINFFLMLRQGIMQQKEISLTYEKKIEKNLLKLSSMHYKIQLWKLLNHQLNSNNVKKKIALDQFKIDEIYQKAYQIINKGI